MAGALTAGEQGHAPLRFDALDGLRGVAALCVVVYHRNWWLGLPMLWQGYLAVDFFFMLSGFVIGHAYGERLATRAIGLGKFAWLRVERLWPLLIAGTTVGLAQQVFRGAWTGETDAIRGAIESYPSGLLLIPHARDGEMFSLNNPTWSLYFELAGNFAFAIVAPFLTTRRLAVVTGLAVAAQILLAVHFRAVEFGHMEQGFRYGAIRMAAPFAIGLLVQRLYAKGLFPTGLTLPFWMLAALLVGILALQPLPGRLAQIQALASILIAFPAILVLGASCRPQGRWQSLALLSAEISYPLYILHLPILDFLRFWLGEAPAHTRWTLLFQTALVVGIALLASRLFDRPVRARLKAWRIGRSTPAELTTK